MKLNKHDVFREVQADLRARDALGWAQHGVALDARYKSELEWLEEAYAEALDKAVYLKAAILRRKHGPIDGNTMEKFGREVRLP